MKTLRIVFMALVTALLVIVGVINFSKLALYGLIDQPAATVISMFCFIGAALTSILTVELAYRYRKQGERFGFSDPSLESWSPIAIIGLLLGIIWVIGAVLQFSAIFSFSLIVHLSLAFLAAISILVLFRWLLQRENDALSSSQSDDRQ